ncbi:hypothetical protein HYPSUDRAFT_40178 [Hypholoma sublateritium FD-334 SS-4]|uniref:Uncharacterized protein n=1 Tax=Hypholoma sublateritium (strain FD-334 SS-4) TaxID=945553 RepID=A0A0D2MHD8_HYPSF|nr:hypothetical protein HYPSUDRAFT_40178 [Hypholoma sublateritium FD-334 SS-4]
MKSSILIFLVLGVSASTVASSKIAEPTYTINLGASSQVEDVSRQIIDVEAFAEEMEYWYDEDMADPRPTVPHPEPTLPPKPSPKPTKIAALEVDQPESTPDVHDNGVHDHATDDEIFNEPNDAIYGEEPEMDGDIVGKFWSDEFEDWDIYGWDNTHDEF